MKMRSAKVTHSQREREGNGDVVKADGRGVYRFPDCGCYYTGHYQNPKAASAIPEWVGEEIYRSELL